MTHAELNTVAKREAERFKQEQDREESERQKLIKEGNSKDFQKMIQESGPVKPLVIV